MIRVDFVQSLPRWLILLRWGLLASGVSAAALMLTWSGKLQKQNEALEWTQRAEVAPAAGRSGRAAGSDNLAGVSTSQARGVQSELELDWRRVFLAIENSVTPEIRMMSIRPDPQRQLLLIQAKAPDGVQAQRFVERLQSDGTITSAHLVHEQRGDDDELLAFSVRARWETEP